MSENKDYLKLLEKQPGYGKITVLVGPDGGGKTFLATQLKNENPESKLFSGMDIESWPIDLDKKRAINKIKKTNSKKDANYYALLALALNKAVLNESKKGFDVIVDSEQTFKWLMWEDMKEKLDSAIQILTSHKIKAVLPDTIRYVVPQADDFDSQAEKIWIQQQGKSNSEKSDVDPKNLGEVKDRLHASEHVILALERLGVKIEGKPSWLK
jgi:hypothetical protein